MQFGFLGMNEKRAPLDIRDKTAFTDVRKLEFLQKAGEAGIEQCLIVSTCNRSEVFFFYEEEGQKERVRKLYETMFSEVEVQKYMEMRCGEEALAYLFRVTAGMESMVVGEDQILGQIKEALDFSRTMGYSGKELNKVVRDAVTCAKRMKTDLRISERPLSVSYIGVKKLEQMVGIEGKKVLVIGSGGTAELALKYMYEYGAGHVSVCSRTAAHAEELRRQFPDICIVGYEERYACMETCDIVVSATGSPHLVVKKGAFVPKRPMAFLDLAVPRDIDLSLADEDGVQVINMDSLQQIASENQREREKLVRRGEAYIREDLEKTMQWLFHSHVDGTIQSLRQRCEEIAGDSYRYLEKKIELGEREKKLLKKVLHASLLRLLREPIQELKQIDSEEAQEEYEKVIQRLFRMEENEKEKRGEVR